MNPDFERAGWTVYEQSMPEKEIHDVLRLIHHDLFRRGMLPDEVFNYYKSANWFPWLRWSVAIGDLERALPSEIRIGQLCEPQIVLQPPDIEEVLPLKWHIDEAPEWAEGRNYSHIVGVPLSRCYEEDGGLQAIPFGSKGLAPINLDVGDVVCFHPKLPHTSGMNRMGTIRYVIYFRYLEC